MKRIMHAREKPRVLSALPDPVLMFKDRVMTSKRKGPECGEPPSCHHCEMCDCWCFTRGPC